MKIDIKHIAKLASLNLNEKEEKKFQRQLSSVLNYVNKLNEINTKNVDATSQVTDLENVTREDNPIPSLSQEQALSNTKSKHNGLFKVTSILKQSS